MATSSCPAAPTLSRALEAFSRIQNMPLTQFYNDVWQKSCEERLNASEEKLEKPEGVGVDMVTRIRCRNPFSTLTDDKFWSAPYEQENNSNESQAGVIWDIDKEGATKSSAERVPERGTI
eukprot:1394282-Amorphochlora_amoeboformis.AAC.1